MVDSVQGLSVPVFADVGCAESWEKLDLYREAPFRKETWCMS